jgi:hypothetical protein
MAYLRDLEATFRTELGLAPGRLREISKVLQSANFLPTGLKGRHGKYAPTVAEHEAVALLLGYFAPGEYKEAANQAASFARLPYAGAFFHQYCPAALSGSCIENRTLMRPSREETPEELEAMRQVPFGYTLMLILNVARRPGMAWPIHRIELGHLGETLFGRIIVGFERPGKGLEKHHHYAVQTGGNHDLTTADGLAAALREGDEALRAAARKVRVTTALPGSLITKLAELLGPLPVADPNDVYVPTPWYAVTQGVEGRTGAIDASEPTAEPTSAQSAVG